MTKSIGNDLYQRSAQLWKFLARSCSELAGELIYPALNRVENYRVETRQAIGTLKEIRQPIGTLKEE